MSRIIGSREVIARAVFEFNKSLPVDLTKYQIIIGEKCNYYYGFLDELANLFTEPVKKSNKPFPAIINLLPEGGKYNVTSEGIKFNDQSILIMMPVMKSWTSEEISYYCHSEYLRPMAMSILDVLSQFVTLEVDYNIYEGSSIAVSDSSEEKAILSEFGDYLAYIYITGLNYFVPKIICENTYITYQEIFKTVNQWDLN